jgi:hypothetical protein
MSTMTSPFTRGSAWGRAQPQHLRPGSFKRGHEKRGGRKRGTPNLLSVDFKKAILEAAYRIGYDGNGKNGVCGYFLWVGERHPKIFYTVLLAGLLRLEIAQGGAPEGTRWPRHEIDQRLRNHIGFTDKNRTMGRNAPVDARSQWSWTGQPLPVGGLMQLAVENPKDFCKLYVAAFMRPQTKRPPIRRAGPLLASGAAM